MDDDGDGDEEEDEEEEEELSQAEQQRRKERAERERWLREQVCIPGNDWGCPHRDTRLLTLHPLFSCSPRQQRGGVSGTMTMTTRKKILARRTASS